MKIHYFNQRDADGDDALLGMAKMQEYVPEGCLLGGVVVMGAIKNGHNPCSGCACDRDRCGSKVPLVGAGGNPDDGSWLPPL